MLSILRRKFLKLTNPRDTVELTASMTIIQVIFGQLPYDIKKLPETNQYECKTSIPGICLCVGYFLFSIMSLAFYKNDIGEELVRTGISYEQVLIGLAWRSIFSFCNSTVILLRKDTIRSYANLLNQISVVFGEPHRHRQPHWKRIHRTILALTSIIIVFFKLFSIFNILVRHACYLRYIILAILKFVQSMCLIHWHYSFINQALNDVYRQEKKG